MQAFLPSYSLLIGGKKKRKTFSYENQEHVPVFKLLLDMYKGEFFACTLDELMILKPLGKLLAGNIPCCSHTVKINHLIGKAKCFNHSSFSIQFYGVCFQRGGKKKVLIGRLAISKMGCLGLKLLLQHCWALVVGSSFNLKTKCNLWPRFCNVRKAWLK